MPPSATAQLRSAGQAALRDFGVQYTEEEISEHVLDEGDLSRYELHLTVEGK